MKGRIYLKPDIYIKNDVVNQNCVFSFNSLNNRLNKVPFDFAPVLWKKDDIEDCVIDQLARKSNNNIYLSLENVVSIIQRNTEEDIYSKKLSRQFYSQHYDFFEVIYSEKKNAIEYTISVLVNTFLSICYREIHLLTLDKLFAIIMDLGLFAITVKKSYSREDIAQWKLDDYRIKIIITLFFAVIETFYSNDMKKLSQELSQETSQEEYQNVLYKDNTDIQSFTQQIINPFQSHLKTNVTLHILNDIPEFIHSAILFTYLYTFPIVEVIISRYSFHNFLYDKVPFSDSEDVISIHRLFRLIPIFNQYKFFLSGFPIANHSFINISWFLHIMKNYNIDISFFEDILLKTFSNEVANIISNKINVKLRLRSLLYFYSLSTNNADIHEKMKSISAFHEFKGN